MVVELISIHQNVRNGHIYIGVMTYSKVVLIFYRYDESKSNLKSHIWTSRHGNQIQYKSTRRTMIKDIKLKKLLSHPENKRVICKLFAEMTSAKFEALQKQYIVIEGTTILANIPDWQQESHDQHEADTLLPCTIRELHLKHHTSSGRAPSFRILSPETDVFIIGIHLVTLSGIEIVFKQITSKKRKVVSLQDVVSRLGITVCEAFLPDYIFTGCDYTGKFNTITKSRALKTLLKSAEDHDLMRGLKECGEQQEISQNLIQSLQKFTVKLFTSKIRLSTVL